MCKGTLNVLQTKYPLASCNTLAQPFGLFNISTLTYLISLLSLSFAKHTSTKSLYLPSHTTTCTCFDKEIINKNISAYKTV